MKKKLLKTGACSSAVEWVKDYPDARSAWEACERGDWMLWIARMLNIDDRKLTLAKYHVANQVRHLMKDERSLAALDAAYKYGIGELGRKELSAYAAAAANAAYAAADADDAAVAANAAYAAYAAYAAAAANAPYAAAAAAADDAAVAANAAYAAYADDDARIASLKTSADICREYLTEEVLKAWED